MDMASIVIDNDINSSSNNNHGLFQALRRTLFMYELHLSS